MLKFKQPIAAPRRNDLTGLLGWLLVALAAGAVGSMATTDATAFYSQLSLPAWAPPASVFGPVWLSLYMLMGLAAWLVWREPGDKPVIAALTLFIVQIVANALWSWLFFAWRLGFAAFAGSVALALLVAATIAAFYRVRRLPALLLFPYLAWVLFAAVLTWSIWRSNLAVL